MALLRHRALLGLLAAVSAAAQGGPQLVLNACSQDADAKQLWRLNATGSPWGPTLSLQVGSPQMCMDIEDFATGVNATVWTWPCGDGSRSNEAWSVNASAIVSLDGGAMCLRAGMPGQVADVGALITTAVCSASDLNQKLAFNAASGRIVHVPTGLCVDAGSPLNWCAAASRANWTICDTSAPLDARVADIVGRLSLSDKIAALGTSTPALPSIGLPGYNWWSESTHGISHVAYSAATPWASNTALPITTSCAFNRSLWRATGNTIGREARAFMNVGNAYSTFWAPVINLVRDPRWGRNIESAGEDPFASGQYAVNFVKGFEHAPEDPCVLQASACCKHFVANELEATNGTDRYHFDAMVPAIDLADSYLPPFQACVQEGAVSGIMCSYNAVNGVPSCANDWLLGTVLRESWQFDGYVTSDCDADSDVYFSHHYTATPELAVRAVLQAGTDVDCGSFVPTYAASALSSGNISTADIDAALSHLFRVRIRLGHFDPPGPLQRIGPDQVCMPASVELARDGARQGTVLLKNAGGRALPLGDPSRFATAAVIGPNANLTDTFTYYGGLPACGNNVDTLVSAVQAFIPRTASALGVPDVASNDTSGVAAAAALAASADVVFLAIGSDLMLEREGQDRTSIDFSDGQKALIAAVAAAAKGPVVACIFSGGAMDPTVLLQNADVDAVLHLGQPSVQVGGAVDIAFGRTPSGTPAAAAGRMSQTSYRASFVDEVSMFDFGMRPGPSVWPPGSTPGRTYRFYAGTAALPYGYGLSYTNWTYTPVSTPASVSLDAARAVLADAAGAPVGHIPPGLKAVNAADLWVNVTNTGSVDSDDVVLGFLVPPGAGTDGVPLQELFGFERVHVPAGQTVTVYLGAQALAFTQARADGRRVAWPGEYRVRFGVAETAAQGMGFAEVRLLAE